MHWACRHHHHHCHRRPVSKNVRSNRPGDNPKICGSWLYREKDELTVAFAGEPAGVHFYRESPWGVYEQHTAFAASPPPPLSSAAGTAAARTAGV